MARRSGGDADADLVARHLAGDGAALGEIYERYADRVYDLCLAMLHSPDDAADAFQDTFLTASTKLGQLRDADRLRSWLYSIARNQCRARLRGRKRTTPDADAGIDVAVEVEMTRLVERAELRTLMAEARAGLTERDQEVLDLHMRHGLDGDELAAALGVSTDNAYKLVQRVRSRVERSLGALLVARHARRECDDLDAVLGDWDGTFSPLIRKRVGRHVDECDTCSRRRKGLLDPGGMASAMPITPAPAALRADVLARMVAGQAPAVAIDSWRPDGFPGRAAPRRGGALLTFVAMTALILAVTVAVVASDVLTSRDIVEEVLPATETNTPTVPTVPPEVPVTTVGPTSTTTTLPPSTSTSTTTTTTTTTTTVPPETVPPETVPPETVPPETVPPETVPPETVPPETVPPDTTPPEVVRFTNSASPIFERNLVNSCASRTTPDQTTVVVLATDDVGVTAVTADWVNPVGSESGSLTLAPTGQTDTWSGVLEIAAGTLPTAVRIEVTATAQDAAGNTDTTDPILVTVIDCP